MKRKLKEIYLDVRNSIPGVKIEEKEFDPEVDPGNWTVV
jgi:hypothetical protein